jgi:hypothetical protein
MVRVRFNDKMVNGLPWFVINVVSINSSNRGDVLFTFGLSAL